MIHEEQYYCSWLVCAITVISTVDFYHRTCKIKTNEKNKKTKKKSAGLEFEKKRRCSAIIILRLNHSVVTVNRRISVRITYYRVDIAAISTFRSEKLIW